MTFLTSTGTKISMTISGIKTDITKQKISALMDTIIEKTFSILSLALMLLKEK